MGNIVPVTGLRGVNLLRDPRRIEDDELVKAQNLVPLKPGVRSKRPGYGYASQTGVAANGSINMLSFSTPSFEASLNFLYTHIVSGVLTVDGTDAANTISWQLDVPGSASVTNPQHVNFNGSTYIFFGYPCGWSGVQVSNQQGAPDISTAIEIRTAGIDFKQFVFAGTDNANLRPRLATQFRNRMVYADFGPGYENTVVFSDNFLPDTVGNTVLAANGRNVIVGGARDGDKIVGMVEVMQTSGGSPSTASLLVLKQYSAYLITGEPNQTTDSTPPLGTLEVMRIPFNCGCASPNTIVHTTYGVIWAGHDDVWFFDAGQVPIRIGSKIRPVLAATPANMRYRWQAAYFNGFYRLAVFSDGQGPTDASPLGEQWWLDLRDGPPQGTPGEMEAHESASWWGPQIYKTVATIGAAATAGTHLLTSEVRPGHPPALYGLEPGVVDGANTFWNVVTYDVQQSFDNAASHPNLHASSGTEILSDLVSKEYDFNDPVLDKTLYGAELATWVGSMARVNMDDIIDGGDQTVAMSQDVEPASGFQLDVDFLDLTSFGGHRTENYALYPSASTPVKYMGKTHQLHVYDSGGFIVTSSNNTFQFSNAQYTNGDIAEATIAVGRYATIDALITAMLAAASTLMAIDSFTYGYDVNGKAVISSTNMYDWRPILLDDATRSSASLWAWLGFNTDVERLAAADQTADNSVYSTTSSLLELTQTNLIVDVIPRRSP